jgi:hypothetical protein
MSLSDQNTSSSADDAPLTSSLLKVAQAHRHSQLDVRSLDLARSAILAASDPLCLHLTDAHLSSLPDSARAERTTRSSSLLTSQHSDRNNNNDQTCLMTQCQSAGESPDRPIGSSRSVDLTAAFMTNRAVATELPLLNRTGSASGLTLSGSHSNHSAIALCAAAMSLSQSTAAAHNGPSSTCSSSLITGTLLDTCSRSALGFDAVGDTLLLSAQSTVASDSQTGLPITSVVSAQSPSSSGTRFRSFNLLRRYRSRFHRANQQHGSCFSNWEPSNSTVASSVVRQQVPWIRPSIGVVSATSTPTGSPDGAVSPAIDLMAVQAALRVGGRGAMGGRSHSASSSVCSQTANQPQPETAIEKRITDDKDGDHRKLDTSIMIVDDGRGDSDYRNENNANTAESSKRRSSNDRQSADETTDVERFGGNRANVARLSLSLATTSSSGTTVKLNGRAAGKKLTNDKGAHNASQPLSPETGSVASSSHQSSQSNVCSMHLEPPTVWRRGGSAGAASATAYSLNSIGEAKSGRGLAGQSSSSGVCVFSCNSSCTSTSAWTSSSQQQTATSTAHLQRLAEAAAAKAGLDRSISETKSNTQTTTAMYASQSGGATGDLSGVNGASAVAGTTSATAAAATTGTTGPTSAAITVKQAWEQKQRISLSKERKAAQVLGIVMGAFIACWLPFFLMYVTLPFCGANCDLKPNAELIIVWLGYINSALNPIIYTIFNLDFRRAFKRIFVRCCTCAKHATARGDVGRSGAKRHRKEGNRAVAVKSTHHHTAHGIKKNNHHQTNDPPNSHQRKRSANCHHQPRLQATFLK